MTLITSFNRFASHLNMLINCPKVRLQVSFIQSLVCCDLIRKYVSRFLVNVYGVKSADWTVYTLNLPSCDAGNLRGGISVGLMVSSFPRVRYVPLYYRILENEKIDMLKTCGGNVDDKMLVSAQAVTDFHWWLENVHTELNLFASSPSQLTLKCDSSLSTLGAAI